MELIVGMVMFTIISITISMLLAPILSAYTRANDFAEYNALLDNIANQIINDISQATDPLPPTQTTGVWTDPNEDTRDRFLTITAQNRVIRYAVTSGVLEREGLIVERDITGEIVQVTSEWFPVFSEDFYKRKNVSFMVEDISTVTVTAYRLTVRLTEDRGPINARFEIPREYEVRPLMLNQG